LIQFHVISIVSTLRPTISHSRLRLILYYSITAVVDLQFLVEAGLYESPDESARREEVLGKLGQVATLVATRVLNAALCIRVHGSSIISSLSMFFRHLQIVKDWVKQLTSQRGYTDQMVEEANAVLFTFGSYRLGVISTTSF
jgi:poly(A) polymerase